jgi:hypothetical protein
MRTLTSAQIERPAGAARIPPSGPDGGSQRGAEHTSEEL